MWVPYTLRKMDHAFMMGRKAKWAENGRLDRRPSEIFRQHFIVAPFPEENVQRVVAEVGIEPIVFGSDFPHGEGLAHPGEYADGTARRASPTTTSSASCATTSRTSSSAPRDTDGGLARAASEESRRSAASVLFPVAWVKVPQESERRWTAWSASLVASNSCVSAERVATHHASDSSQPIAHSRRRTSDDGVVGSADGGAQNVWWTASTLLPSRSRTNPP